MMGGRGERSKAGKGKPVVVVMFIKTMALKLRPALSSSPRSDLKVQIIGSPSELLGQKLWEWDLATNILISSPGIFEDTSV